MCRFASLISSPHPWQERSELWNLDVRLHTLQSRLNQTLTQAEVMKGASGPPPAAEANGACKALARLLADSNAGRVLRGTKVLREGI